MSPNSLFRARALPRSLAVLVFALALSSANLPRPALAQGILGRPHHWRIQVDNETPEGHNWSFNAFYPQSLSVHAGDTITLTVANNPNAFHHPVVLPPGFTPAQFYSGFMFPDPYVEHGFQTTWFNATSVATARPRPPCGRADQPACAFKGDRPFNTAMLVTPPSGEGVGNPSFTFSLDAGLPPGSYYFLCSVHGPDMQGHFDVLPDNAPVQSDAALAADARRAYGTDVERLGTAEDAIAPPTFTTNTDDGRKTCSLLPFLDLRTLPPDNKRLVTFQVLPLNRYAPVIPMASFMVDNKQFDMNRVDQIVLLGATEEWTVRNGSNVWHPFHIHTNHFQLTQLNGQPVEARSLKDTVPIPPFGEITMRSRFLDFTGKFVFHCHILQHEDGGMMQVVEVVSPDDPLPMASPDAEVSKPQLLSDLSPQHFTCPIITSR